MVTKHWHREYCGLGSWRPQFLQCFGNIRCFTIFAALITVVQGIYLGYMIGVLTTIEKRFEIPSAWSGGLLSIYDFGHAISVLLVGHFGSVIHQPKWIAGGAAVSSLASFGLLLPHVIFGGGHQIGDSITGENYTRNNWDNWPYCQWKNDTNMGKMDTEDECVLSIGHNSNQRAYWIFALFQLLAGVASSPFTTLAYVYIDDNATRKQSPFYMGVVTAMWAYGPALGFGLSSYTTQIWIELGESPQGITTDSPEWIGAWWLGLVVLCILYLCFGLPFLFYPKTLRRGTLTLTADPPGEVELMALQDIAKSNSLVNRKNEKTIRWCLSRITAVPLEFLQILRNPMVLSLSFSWVAAAYLFGGYSTFLPKYLEVVFYKPTFVANILGGIVAVIGVATSTAVGGKVLSCLNLKASKALMLVFVTFSNSLVAFIILMFISCDNPLINGLTPDAIQSSITSNNFTAPICSVMSNRNEQCYCDPMKYSPVCDSASGKSYFSPCYLGCTNPENGLNGEFDSCPCASGPNSIQPGVCAQPCSTKLTLYLIGSFLSGAVGAFFQMALFTNIIWAVPKEKKTNVVALSNFLMSVLGFIPSQVVFGKIFDSTCVAWSADPNSPCQSGYCLLYNNKLLRFRYHATTAAFQFAAMAFVLIGHFVSRNFQFPKHDEDEKEEEDDNVSADFPNGTF